MAKAPALLAPSAFRSGDRQFAGALFSDGAYCGRPGQIPGVAMRAARAGDRLVLSGIGFGPVNPDVPAGVVARQAATLAGVTIRLNGVDCPIEYAGLAPGSVGLYQFNIMVPAAVTGDAQSSVSAAGVALKQVLWVATE